VDQRAVLLEDLALLERNLVELLVVLQNSVRVDIFFIQSICFVRSIFKSWLRIRKRCSTFALVYEVILTIGVVLIQLHSMVELLRVHALGITDGVLRAALPDTLADADVRNILHHAPDRLLVGIVVLRWWLPLLFISPHWRASLVVGILFFRLFRDSRCFFCWLHHLVLLLTGKSKVDDYMVGCVEE